MEELKRLVDERRSELMGLPNVVGVAVGFKRRDGKVTGQPSLVVLVRRKLPLAQLAPGEVVPERVGDVPTDVVEVGDVRALEVATAPPEFPADTPEAHRQRLRPARPGTSIGHYLITAGTFGAVVYDRKTGEPLILSNNHVLANSRTLRGRQAKLGDAIYQPGPYDGGSPDDVLAALYRFVPLRFPGRSAEGQQVTVLNRVDAAVARPMSADSIEPAILGAGPVTGSSEASLELPVRKSGRTTGCTQGRVTALHATLQVSYGRGRLATFSDQIVLSPMSEGGDSGSLITDTGGRAVALLFAGSPSATIASPIAAVEESLRVSVTPPLRSGAGVGR